jgi:hypothetical protein
MKSDEFKLIPIPVKSGTPGIEGTQMKDFITGCPIKPEELRHSQVAYCLICGFVAGFFGSLILFMVIL